MIVNSKGFFYASRHFYKKKCWAVVRILACWVCPLCTESLLLKLQSHQEASYSIPRNTAQIFSANMCSKYALSSNFLTQLTTALHYFRRSYYSHALIYCYYHNFTMLRWSMICEKIERILRTISKTPSWDSTLSRNNLHYLQTSLQFVHIVIAQPYERHLVDETGTFTFPKVNNINSQ